MLEFIVNRLKKSLLDISRCYNAIPYIFLDKHYNRTSESKSKSLAIIKLDEIGDYILFRNFLKIVRNSKKFKDYHLTLIGNIIWKEIAESFDKDFVNQFIWLDKYKLINSYSYRKEKLQHIFDSNFEITINPLSSRNYLLDDSIIKASSSKEKIGYFSDASSSSGLLNKIGNKYYSQLLKLPENIHFEFYRNKFFFENILNEKISITKPFLNPVKPEPSIIINKYVVIFPGASKKHKRWPSQNFRDIINYLKNNFSFNVIILGGQADVETAKEIKRLCINSEIIDLTGKTNLIDFINLIGNAELVISNDTSAAHIGAAADVNTIIISDGSRFGRFIPYPPEQLNVKTIFPSEIMMILKNLKWDYLYKKFKYKSSLKISSITTESVIDEINKFLLKKTS